ncbi:hypothetical protein SEUCBS139899_003030 [Sporothrix eucalyptigena]|uniref:Benzoate 4-monooxygenase cytochrome P450 n=1 Tax=Sporothrix eucalyptigena TaxID=1812306 RepID=A0ABP0CWJ7_9PEZI
MIITSLPYALAALVVVGLVYPIVAYLVDRHGLRKYPAPGPAGIAAFTPLWQMYYNYFGVKYLAVDHVHKQLGPVVRLGPKHVSFSSPQAFREIYGHGTSIIKDTFYDNQAGGNPNMADVTNKEVHRGKRKNLSFVFAAKQIIAMEPRVMAIVEKLLKAVAVKSQGGRVSSQDRFVVSEDGVFDIRPWLNMFSYDAITNIFWSKTYGFLDRGDDDCLAQNPDGTVQSVHAMQTFHTGAAWSVFLGHLTPFWYGFFKRQLLSWTFRNKCGDNFTGMARYLATQRLQNPPSEPDLFSNLPVTASAKRPDPMSMEEIIAESSVMLNAGNDTTQSSLTNTVYYLAKNSDKQAKLRNILKESLPAASIPVASYEQLQHIPYLRACIDESFRMHAPLGTGAPRLTTEPTVIDGEQIPAGVTVSNQTWSLHRNEILFRDALSYIPERWLPENPDFTDEERQNLKDFVAPFSMGPRACIGRNLAYMELSICIASLVMAFDWELGQKDYVLKYHERFNCNPIELPIKATPLL